MDERKVGAHLNLGEGLLLENIQIQFQSPADIERMLSHTSGFKL